MKPTTRFLHTADWQLGKPFAGVEDIQKRSRLQLERFTVLKRVGQVAREMGAQFVLVAGDLFDSPRATKSTVAAACSAIGEIGIPVFAVPGNHDHGGAGSLWDQVFFQREREELAPNFTILLQPEPVELETAVLFPCPLLRRHEAADPTAWLRSTPEFDARFGDKPRIILAHGSVLNFGSFSDDEESDTGAPNLSDLARLSESAFVSSRWATGTAQKEWLTKPGIRARRNWTASSRATTTIPATSSSSKPVAVSRRKSSGCGPA